MELSLWHFDNTIGGVVLHLPKWDNRVNMNLTTSVYFFFSLLLFFFSKLSYDFYICIFVVILNAYKNYSNYVIKWITYFFFSFFILFMIITTFKSILVRLREWKSNHNYPWVVFRCQMKRKNKKEEKYETRVDKKGEGVRSFYDDTADARRQIDVNKWRMAQGTRTPLSLNLNLGYNLKTRCV